MHTIFPELPERMSYPIILTLFGMEILTRLVQYENAQLPIVFTPSCTVTFKRALHSIKEFSPILSTLPGIVTFFKAEHAPKAASSILSTPLASVSVSKALHLEKAP